MSARMPRRDDQAVPDGTHNTRRRRAWRIVVRLIGGLVATILLFWLILYVTKGRFFRHPFERIAGAALHRTLTVSGDFQLFFDPIDVRFVAERMAISNPAWASRPALFVARRVAARIATVPLVFGRRRMRTLDLADAAVDLEWSRDHRLNSWTFSDKKGGKPFRFPVIGRATVSGTMLHYADPRTRLSVDARFNEVRSRDARIGRAIRFTGGGIIRDTPFTLTGALLSPDATVARGRNVVRLTAQTRRDTVDLAATLPSVAEIEHVPLAVNAHGENLANLLDVIGVAVPGTRRYALAATLVVDGIDYRFTGLRGRFGESDLAGGFTVHASDRMYIKADLTTHRLDIADAAPFIGYNPDLAAIGTVQKIAGVPRILPDTPLRIDALRAFDADVRWTVATVRSRNVPLSDIALTLALDHSLLRLTPVSLTMARGRLTGGAVIDARRTPVHAVADFKLASTPIRRLLSGFGAIEAGTTGAVHGRLHLEGDGDSLHRWLAAANGRMALVVPRGTFWMRNVQLSELDVGVFLQRLLQGKLKEPVQVNCGLVAFTVRDGVAAADPILIDTTKNVIVGQGAIRFGSEAIDLRIRGKGKKFSLLSAQSPISIAGYLGAPRIVLLSRPLGLRVGAGVALGLIAPPAALLAFVDPGLAKSASCGPILAGASAAAQRTTKGDKRSDVGTGSSASKAPGKRFLGIF